MVVATVLSFQILEFHMRAQRMGAQRKWMIPISRCRRCRRHVMMMMRIRAEPQCSPLTCQMMLAMAVEVAMEVAMRSQEATRMAVTMTTLGHRHRPDPQILIQMLRHHHAESGVAAAQIGVPSK